MLICSYLRGVAFHCAHPKICVYTRICKLILACLREVYVGIHNGGLLIGGGQYLSKRADSCAVPPRL
jgi:hypothetical protein